MKVFDVLNIELKGNNLVEASAGTGKTYAIGILVLRLLLEYKIKIEQILMVTYTNAAVDELELRIRKFISDAILHTRKISESEDKLIREVLQRSIENIGQENTLKLLSEAVEFLDETSIFTIHGFCKRVLTDYAFENSMLLNTEIIDDQSSLIENAVTEFWRKNITILDPGILSKMIEKDFSVKNISEIYAKTANGAKLKINNYHPFFDIFTEFENLNQKLKFRTEDFIKTIENSWPEIIPLKLGNLKKINKAIGNRSANDLSNEFLVKLKEDNASNLLAKLDFLFPAAYEVLAAEGELAQFVDDILALYYQEAVSFVEHHIELKKNRNKLVSFYDLIKILHNTVVNEGNPLLKKELNYKYKAIFIDEFQDTDILQYQIFQKLFVENTDSILYFIGDPKQSIYAFRGADLDTYNLAKDNLKDSLFSMNTNFRSTKSLLEGINEFFRKDNKKENEKIDNLNYIKVKFGNDLLGELLRNGSPANAFEIINKNDTGISKDENQDDILESMVSEIIDLLSKNNIIKNNKQRPVIPSDIGILVRSKAHGKLIKEKLSRYNIPAIVVDDAKVLETNEAKDLYYLLYAILDPNNSSISRALLSSFTGFNPDHIRDINFELLKERFKNLQDTWNLNGVYAAVSEFIHHFDIRSNLIFSDNTKGKRIYTNLLQLAEILNEKEIFDGLTSIQVLDCLLRARQGDKNIGKYEQQLEDDENSIQIVTVHKSKGLAYNIVILPLFNLTTSNKKHFCIEYKDKSGQKIVSIYNDSEETEYNRLQQEQENDRLLYVAITRAVYKCIIYHKKNDDGILTDYIERIGLKPRFIIFKSPENPDKSYRFTQNTEREIDYTPRMLMSAIDNSWKVTSYSALSTNKDFIYKFTEKSAVQNNIYDEFIFNQLEKGFQTGLLIHKILEKINFSNPSNYRFTIIKVLNDFGINTDDTTIDHHLELIGNILNTLLFPMQFKLSDITFEKRISELEFYFSFDKFKTSELNSLLPHLNLSYTEIEGIMHGFIDLVFEYNDKYFILDWKTNHLGYKPEDYSFDSLEQEIRQSSYELQYLIYTIALTRYLRSKKSDFDFHRDFGGVYYLFIRGMRTGQSTGIYYKKPDVKIVRDLQTMMTSKQ